MAIPAPAGPAENETPHGPRWQFAVASGILGWVLDAFDFFVIVFLFDIFAARFHVSKRDIIFTIALTLAMRPVGALIFGSLADRFGRRVPLMLCVAYFSAASLGSALVPSYGLFVLLRALYGIGMGGYWGIGASYAMESAPRRLRGLFSGIMQAGYPAGYLLASIGMLLLAPRFGWVSLFYSSAAVALVVIAITAIAPESRAWRQHATSSFGNIFRMLFRYWRIFLYLLAVMTAMICLSHGTQDLYPDFLKSIPQLAGAHILGMKALYGVPILYNLAGIAGALFFGSLSERFGRRRAMLCALALCLVALPPWAFGVTVTTLVLGSVFLQTGVQGAYGVIPAHLSELSPDPIRSLFPGFVYQLGVLFASPAVSVEYALREHFGYPRALTFFELAVILVLMLLFSLGPERRGRDFFLASPAHKS
jgi:SHS family lactate transporter-like MFS transporter